MLTSFIIAMRIYLQYLNQRLKGKFLKLYLQSCGCKVGKRLICKKWPIFRTIPNRNIHLGDDVIIGYYITFDIIKPGVLNVGNRVELSHNIILGSLKEISIGNDCLVGENVSIRDDNHNTLKNIPINVQGWSSKPVIIENDVWIGAGTCVLYGAKISSGAVIGANSVVLSKSHIQSNYIYAGSPVKEIRKR